MIQVTRAKRSRVARKLAEAASVGTIIHLQRININVRLFALQGLRTASSEDSFAGRFGRAITIFLRAWSKACEKSNGVCKSLFVRY